MKIKNCTPHPIIGMLPDGGEITFWPIGTIPRVGTIETPSEEIMGIPCVTQSMGEVEGLPDPEDGVFLLVSGMVFNATTDRLDVIAPDTGKGVIRDNQGRILAVTRFLRK